MDDRHLEPLSRFFDGEAVDPPLLAESLADAEAAGYLSEWATLRAWVHEDDTPPSADFYARMSSVLKRTRFGYPFWGRWVQPAIAAALIVIAAVTGYQAGSRRQGDRASKPMPATPVQQRIADTASPTQAAQPVVAFPRHESRPAPRPSVDGKDWPAAAVPLRFQSWRETRPGED